MNSSWHAFAWRVSHCTGACGFCLWFMNRVYHVFACSHIQPIRIDSGYQNRVAIAVLRVWFAYALRLLCALTFPWGFFFFRVFALWLRSQLGPRQLYLCLEKSIFKLALSAKFIVPTLLRQWTSEWNGALKSTHIRIDTQWYLAWSRTSTFWKVQTLN